jgi:hypothetical protein
MIAARTKPPVATVITTEERLTSDTQANTEYFNSTNLSALTNQARWRVDLTVWVSDDVAQNWAAKRRNSRDGQARYSDLAIGICLTWRVDFQLVLRQSQGFMRSIARLMSLDIAGQNSQCFRYVAMA